jgi:hypothetical protein
VLDAGALIALDRGNRRMIALLEEVIERGGDFEVPAAALGQAWRDGSRQAVLAKFIRGAEVRIVPLDESTSRACGELLAASGTSDVVDASVVIVAGKNHAPIVTSDVDDLRRLSPRAVLFKI